MRRSEMNKGIWKKIHVDLTMFQQILCNYVTNQSKANLGIPSAKSVRHEDRNM